MLHNLLTCWNNFPSSIQSSHPRSEAPPILTTIIDVAEHSLEHCLDLSCTFQQKLQEHL
uniref:Uncharacterized protein n=1 Tax=Arundo donax TaxID=35708 RepID=A0A0A9ESY8_ARUDO